MLTRCSKESPEGLVAHEVLDPWVEGTSTHDEWVDGVAWGAGQGHSPLPDRFKRPAWDSEEAAEATPVPGEALAHRFVITALLQRWSRARGSNHGVVVRLRSPRSSAAGVYYGFRSRECPYVNERPRVRIRYRGSPPLPEPAAAALPPPDRESLPALTAYLRQAPDDVEVRLARATLYARQRVFSQSWQDLETCLGLRLPEDPHPGISYAALGIFRRLHAEYQAPTVTEEEFRKFPKPATVLDVVWRGLTPETAPAETIPSREERRWVIRSRIGYHPEVKYLVGLWRGAQHLWPDDPELRYEVAETVLDELERRVGYAGGESASAFTRGQLESLLATDERSLSPSLRARGEVLLERLGGR